MKRKRVKMIVASVLAVAMVAGTAAAASGLEISPGSLGFYLDDQKIDLSAYAINGNNYVKLRDLL